MNEIMRMHYVLSQRPPFELSRFLFDPAYSKYYKLKNNIKLLFTYLVNQSISPNLTGRGTEEDLEMGLVRIEDYYPGVEYSLSGIGKLLNCSEGTAKRYVDELISAGLGESQVLNGQSVLFFIIPEEVLEKEASRWTQKARRIHLIK